MLLAFSFLGYSCVYGGIFQKLHDVWYCNRLNAETDVRIQLSSPESDIRDLQKCDTVPLLAQIFLLKKKTVIFRKYVTYVNTSWVYCCCFF